MVWGAGNHLPSGLMVGYKSRAICVYICIYICVCVCVCVRANEICYILIPSLSELPKIDLKFFGHHARVDFADLYTSMFIILKIQ
jgi:hypothetical protein